MAIKSDGWGGKNGGWNGRAQWSERLDGVAEMVSEVIGWDDSYKGVEING